MIEESVSFGTIAASAEQSSQSNSNWQAQASQLNLPSDDRLDHFIEGEGYHFAGGHVIIDLWGATNLDKADIVEEAFKEAIRVCSATLLHMHFHCFEPNGGISGVAVLAESHMSIHTWPELGYAALDVFMCGDSQPIKSVEVFKKYFKAERVNVSNLQRGRTDER